MPDGPLHDISSTAKHAIDALSIGTMAAALLQFLPSIAAGATLIWTLIRIYETETVQSVLLRFGWLSGKEGGPRDGQ